ncbi:proline dehydrogenase family protein [Haloferula sp. A504]|uniref:proline dehydrogenase family protein n=1 Tax=Haloferula sp. A504 TaxID=3373601 RepID=UPI0031BDC487|nr:proline dehydrogenase family protein [Verrucomicrobiaceae bacterium E54]
MNPLVRLIPSPLVRFFARPYVAGDSIERALQVAEALQERGVASTLDLLAEAIETPEIAERNQATYLEMIDAVASRFPDPASRPSLSLKLSSFTTDPLEDGGHAAGSAEAARVIAAAARERGVALTIDMESRHWTDFTLDLVHELHEAGHTHVGTVLQTRLRRTGDDLDRLPPGSRVRLVIGIYQEPAEVALSNKEEMKSRMLEFGERLLERGHYVEFGTHDEKWIRRFVDRVLECHGPERFEIQTLYGVPRERITEELRQRGCIVRQYVPFALGWPMAIDYLRRRLDEFPAMMFLVAKNWFGAES